MHKVIDHFYEVDGNRGIPVSFYELDDYDTPDIVSQIIEYIEVTGKLPQTEFAVHLIDPITDDDVFIGINPFDYM